MKNIELKVIASDFKKIKLVLKEYGAEFKGILVQVDTYYNSKKGRLKIREINNNKFQLIFYNRPDKIGSKVSDYEVIEFDKKRNEQAKLVLKKVLGEKIIVSKIRNLWIYKNTRIHLDKVVELGNFLELETVVNKINMKQGKIEHNKIIELLGLGKHKKIKGSYSDLLLRKK